MAAGIGNAAAVASSSPSPLLPHCSHPARTSPWPWLQMRMRTPLQLHLHPALASASVSVPSAASPGGGRSRFQLLVARAASAAAGSPALQEEEELVDAEILRLQNGSDIRGVAMEGEPGRSVTLTPAAVFHIGAAFGRWVAENRSGETSQVRVSVGRDPRLSGPSLLAAVAAGLQSSGCVVYDMGLATTPACFMSTVLPGFLFDASIMLTASHLPFARNGLKFFTPRGGLDVADIEAICLGAGRDAAKNASPLLLAPALLQQQRLPSSAVMAAYAAHLREVIKKGVAHPDPELRDRPLQGLKLVVNAGNGSGGFFARDVLEPLGADVSGSLYLDPDGLFPNHAPNPEDKKAMAATVESVLRSTADLGVVFDTDVDRSGVVDQEGRVMNGDRLIALLAAIVLEERGDEKKGATIVTDARTSYGLTAFIERRGGTHCLFRVGYRNVINKGVQLNASGVAAPLMMETSGHGAMAENYFLDDGAYSAVKIIIHLVRLRLRDPQAAVGQVISDLEEPPAGESVELRINILSAPQHVKRRGAELVEAFRRFLLVSQENGGDWRLGECGDCWVSDGCLVDWDLDTPLPADTPPPPGLDAHMYRAQVENTGWVHLRQSIHNPNLALNLQGSRAGACREMAHTLLHSFLLSPPAVSRELDLSDLHRFLEQKTAAS